VEPHDDPEARLRELERELMDRAAAAEAGTRPMGVEGSPRPGRPSVSVGYPSPPSSGGFPAPPPAARPRARLQWGGLVAGVALVVAAIAGVIVLLSSKAGERDAGIVGAGGAFDPGAGVDDSPTPVAPTPPIGQPTRTAAAPGEQISVSGFDRDIEIACESCIVTVSGKSNRVTITGHCAALTVSGVQNEVILDSVDSIGVSGIENRVNYNGGDPEVRQSGFDNVVEQH